MEKKEQGANQEQELGPHRGHRVHLRKRTGGEKGEEQVIWLTAAEMTAKKCQSLFQGCYIWVLVKSESQGA